MSENLKIQKNQVAIALAGLAVGVAVGFSADRGVAPSPADRVVGCEEQGGCPMMKKMGGMGGMHMMPDGSMMMNDGGSMDMGAMMMDMTARLEGKKGDALDKVFLEDMIVHHQGAVDMAVLLRDGTARPEMKQFAADIIRVQTAEIEQMKAWEKSWFGN